MVDLWPESLETDIEERAPITILRQQASLLAGKTRNLLEAEVRIAAPEGFAFAYAFNLVAPGLNHYTYRLFSIYHGITFYPLDVEVDKEVLEEIAPEAGRILTLESESELTEILAKIFRAEKTLSVIKAIMAQVTHDGPT